MQLFSAVFFKKKFDPENINKLPSKVAHDRPPTFFFSTGPAAKRPKIPYPQKSLIAELDIYTGHITQFVA